ncbi:MAG: DUF4160 domain-containing protein [Bacteroidota bacterium]|nr:DUF4160 domain-containing protein [Bacteroidota bacterium]
MFYYDNKEHSLPHIHIEYAEYNAVVSLPEQTCWLGIFLRIN